MGRKRKREPGPILRTIIDPDPRPKTVGTNPARRAESTPLPPTDRSGKPRRRVRFVPERGD